MMTEVQRPALGQAADPAPRPSLVVIAILVLLQFVDGIDQVALSIVAPHVRQELGLSFSAIGAAFGAGFFGTALGAVLFGTLADRLDRKAVLCSAALGFAAGSLLTIWVRTASELFVIRLATGMALGGLFPVVSAFAIENAPARMRATATALIAVATTLGAAACGPVVAVLQPDFGWRSIFILGGVAPAVLAVLAMLSIRRPKSHRDAAKPKLPKNERRGSPLWSPAILFQGETRRLTLLLWLSYVAISIPMFFTLSWLPTLAHDAKIAPTAAAIAPSIFTLAGVSISLVIARVIDWSGISVLIVATGLGAVALALLGRSFGDQRAFLVACGFAGACCVSSNNLIGPAAALMYEDTLRAQGVGWAVAVMRLGAAAAPALGGLMLARGISTESLFLAFAACPLVSACALFLLRGRPLADGRPEST